MLRLFPRPKTRTAREESLSSVHSDGLIQRGSIRYVGPCQLFVNCNFRRNAFAGPRLQFGAVSEGQIVKAFLSGTGNVLEQDALHGAA